jgi:hypothetical protein
MPKNKVMPNQPIRPNPVITQNRNSERSMHHNLKKPSNEGITQNHSQMRQHGKNVLKMQPNAPYNSSNNPRFQKSNYATPYKPNQHPHGPMPPSSNIRYNLIK